MLNIMRETTFDEGRYRQVANRLADEMSRGITLRRIAIETSIEHEQLARWATEPEAFLYNPPRYELDASQGEIIESKLGVWLDQQRAEREAKPFTPDFVETSVSRTIMGGFEMAREMIQMVEISARPGHGKTSAARHYLAQQRKAAGFACPVWMITLHEANISLKIIYKEILSQLKSSPRWPGVDINEKATEYELLEMVENHVDRMKDGGLLIIDEAQHIGQFNGSIRPNGGTILNGLRTLTDRELFGIALISNGEAYQLAKRSRSVQISSRMEAWRVDAKSLTADDIDCIMSAWNVSGKAERELCIKIGTGDGGLRSLTGIFKRAQHKYGIINAKTMSIFL